jgi:hypothetical protein
MPQPISQVLKLLLILQRNIIFIPLIIEYLGDWSFLAFLLPLLQVLKVEDLVEGGVGDEAVLVGESERIVFELLISGESEVLELWFREAVGVEIGIDTRDAFLIRTVKIVDGVPHLLLQFEIMFEIIDKFIICIYFSLIMELIQLRMHIFFGLGILMW